MAIASGEHPGGMVAIASADASILESAMEAGRSAGALTIAAHNAPDETVLSGDETAIRAVIASAPAVATRVPTSGAWHSPAMTSAVPPFRAALAAIPPRPLRCAFISASTGRAVDREGDIADLLAGQLVSKALWSASLAAARSRVTAAVTLGPGAVLRALWHRNGLTSLPLFATDDDRSIAETIAALRSLP